jgi:hypothetical protein
MSAKFTTALVLCVFSATLLLSQSNNSKSTENTLKNASENVSANLQLTAKDTLSGMVISAFSGIAKVRERARFLADSVKYQENLLPFVGAIVDSFTLVNNDTSEQTLKRTVHCRIPVNLIALGDLYYCQAPIQTTFLYDIFEAAVKKRSEFVVETDVKNQYALTIVFPDDLKLETKPENKNVVMQNSKSRVQYLASVNGNNLHILFKTHLFAGKYPSDDIEQLRTLTQDVVAKKAESIILRKK